MSREPLVSAAVAAAHLGLTPKAFDHWIARNAIRPDARVGYRRRFKLSSLEAVARMLQSRAEAQR